MGFLLDIPMSTGATAGYHRVGVLKSLGNNGVFLIQTFSWLNFAAKKAGNKSIYAIDIIIPVDTSYFSDFLTEEKAYPAGKTDTVNAYNLVASLDGTQPSLIFGDLATIPFSYGIPSLTTIQRDILIFSENDRIFNETTERYQAFIGGNWVDQ